MKIAGLVLSAISFLLITPKLVSGNTDIQISGNGEGSSSNVSVKNNSFSSSNDNNSSQVTTDIRIETNGEVKEFHGTGDQSVRLESGDGKNSVSVSNNINSSTNPTTPKPSPTGTQKNVDSADSAKNEVHKEIKQSGLFGLLIKQLESIIRSFHF